MKKPIVKKNPARREFSIGNSVYVIDRNDKKIKGVIAYARDGKYRVKDENGDAMENNHFISGYRISGRKAGVKKNPAPKKYKDYVVFIVGDGYESRITGGFSTPSEAKKYINSIDTDREYIVRGATLTDYGPVLYRGNRNTQKPKKNPIIPGITARPVKSKRKPVFAVEHAKDKTGPWSTAGLFPNRTLASDYAQAMHSGNPGKWWRVVLK